MAGLKVGARTRATPPLHPKESLKVAPSCSAPFGGFQACPISKKTNGRCRIHNWDYISILSRELVGVLEIELDRGTMEKDV